MTGSMLRLVMNIIRVRVRPCEDLALLSFSPSVFWYSSSSVLQPLDSVSWFSERIQSNIYEACKPVCKCV